MCSWPRGGNLTVDYFRPMTIDWETPSIVGRCPAKRRSKKRRLELTRGNEDEIDRGEAAGVANPKLAGVVF
jgi:hypothetical protein